MERDAACDESDHGGGDPRKRPHSRILGVSEATNRSIIGVTCSGTSSWLKWPDPMVTPIWMSPLRDSRRAGSLLPPVRERKTSNGALAVRNAPTPFHDTTPLR